MRAIRILVVDDSVVIRKLLSDTLSGDRALEVVGTASDGRIGLARIAQLKPDLVTLDIEMPVMNGLETLAALRKLYPKLPVIMFSTLTERGAAATLDALSLGASDYATKPSNTGSPAVAIDRIRTELIPKIKALCGAVAPLTLVALPQVRPVVKARVRSNARIEIVAIGTSSWCSTCRRFLRGCWQTGWQATPPFPWKRAVRARFSRRDTLGSRREISI